MGVMGSKPGKIHLSIRPERRKALLKSPKYSKRVSRGLVY
jgi:hypothetical protein